jgi:hypothetical protein
MMIEYVKTIAEVIGDLDQDQLQELASQLACQHTEAADILGTYIDYALMDKQLEDQDEFLVDEY